jgi:hypothetical protein
VQATINPVVRDSELQPAAAPLHAEPVVCDERTFTVKDATVLVAPVPALLLSA